MVFKVLPLTFAENHFEEDRFVIPCRLKRFSLAELQAATQNFSYRNILGRGGFEKVYEGRLADGSLVAVKRLREERTPGGELQFQTEVEMANATTHHPNLLRLRGLCMTRTERMLVYPLMVKGSVASWLRERAECELPLAWHTRKHIALGAARGLVHLHESGNFQIIHRDIKAANILLDGDFNAVLCDFGLAEFVHHKINRNRQVQQSNLGFVVDPFPEPLEEDDWAEESSTPDDHIVMSCLNFTRTTNTIVSGEEAERQTWFTGAPSCRQIKNNSSSSAKNEYIKLSRMIQDRMRSRTQQGNEDVTDTHVTTAVRGTIGHIAPEYLSTGKCSVKTDVFGYGVMLLELISGQRGFDLARFDNDDDVMLVDWVKSHMMERKLELVIDSDMMGVYDEKEVEQLLQVALLCTQGSPWGRPKMPEVIQMLVGGPDGVFLAQKWKEKEWVDPDTNQNA